MNKNSDNKRIAINTIVLYIRLIINVIIGLYTSRIVLECLGAEDYGLYSVVGGIVTMMNFLGSSMLSTSYRYIAVEMGKGPKGNLNNIYNTVFLIHIFLAILLIIIGETLGTYYVNYHLNVDPQKIPDALFVLRWSLYSCAFVVISVPSNGLIIAREKFIFTSTVEILRTLIKLGLVLYLAVYTGNKLELYAVIMAIFNLFLPICYTSYCYAKEYKVIKFKINRKWADYKLIFNYAFWIMIGAISCMAQNQGAAILVNTFFTLAANAAFGLANQINGYMQMLVKSLSQATVPQIMKSYSSGNKERSLTLMFMISKYSFFMFIIPSSILYTSLDEVLILWLKEVPQHTAIFLLLLLLNSMVYTLECGFDSCIQATGKIRLNQIGFSIIGLSVFPISYLLYSFGFPIYTTIICTIVASISIIIFHCYILKKLVDFSFKRYCHMTLIPALKIFIPLSGIIILLKIYINSHSILENLLLKSGIISLVVIFLIYFLGLSNEEKYYIKTVFYKIKK